MTTLSRDKPRAIQTDDSNGLPVAAATQIFEGAAVGFSAGYARPLVSGDRFAGFATRRVDNRAGAAGAVDVRLQDGGDIELPVAGVTVSSVGLTVYATDDDSFTLTPGGSAIGVVKRFVSTGVAVVRCVVVDLLTTAELTQSRALVSPDGKIYPSLSRATQAMLGKWRAALANAQNGASNARIAFVGDSTTAGYFATGVQWANNWPLAVPKAVATLLAGRGIATQTGSTFGSGGANNVTNFLAWDTRWTAGSGWTIGLLTDIPGGSAFSHNAANTNAANFTPTQAFDTIEVWTVTNPAYQDFTIAIDGGAALATVDASQALSILKTTVTVALGTHTINIAKTAANAALTHILGINTFDSATKAVHCWNIGAGGSTSAVWGTSSSSVWLAPNLLATYAPDLTVICLGINDWIAAVSSATFQTNMQVLINKALLSGSAILVTPPPTQIGYSATTQANMDAIRDAIATLASTNNIPLVDIFGRFVSYTDANALGFYGDGAHPDRTGYQDWANALVGFIAP